VAFTSVRDPIETFESGYVYYGLDKKYNMTINEFALTHANMEMTRPPNSVFHKNNQLRDMGLDESLLDNKTEVINKIEQLDKVMLGCVFFGKQTIHNS
jgi:hypothetical protein